MEYLTTEGTGFRFLDEVLRLDKLIDLGIVLDDVETAQTTLAKAFAWMSRASKGRIHVFVHADIGEKVGRRFGLALEDATPEWAAYAVHGPVESRR